MTLIQRINMEDQQVTRCPGCRVTSIGYCLQAIESILHHQPNEEKNCMQSNNVLLDTSHLSNLCKNACDIFLTIY